LPPRWRYALAMLAWLFEFFLLIIAFVFIVGADVVTGQGSQQPTSPWDLFPQELAMTIPLVASLTILAMTWGVPSFAAVGLIGMGPARRYVLRDVAFGLLLGPLAVGVMLLAGLIGGWDRVVDVASLGVLAQNLVLGVLLFLCVALFEEIAGRGCLVALLAR